LTPGEAWNTLFPGAGKNTKEENMDFVFFFAGLAATVGAVLYLQRSIK
jgi:hypothetical protein